MLMVQRIGLDSRMQMAHNKGAKMYKAKKDNKIIAISDTDNEFVCLVKDGVVEDTEHIADDYDQYNGEYLLKSEIPAPSAEEQIAELKKQLDNTDYKIIKCSEYQLAGVELPYDIAELHAQRQALRDEINELEQGK